jgi:hypothetical protein
VLAIVFALLQLIDNQSYAITRLLLKIVEALANALACLKA